MSKRCPDCGFVNDDSRIYCGSCGELLDANLRLLKKLNDQTSQPSKPAAQAAPPKREPAPAPKPYNDDYNDEPLNKLAREKKSAMPWIILGLAAAAAVVAIVLFLL